MNSVSVFHRKRKNGESQTYYCRYPLGNGRYQLINLQVTDKMTAQKKALDLFRKKQRQAVGLELSDAEETAVTRDITGYVADFLQSLRDRNRNAVYHRHTQRALEEGITYCKFKRLQDIRPQPLQRWLSSINHLSDRTLRNNASYWQSFMLWLVKQEILPRNPLSQLVIPTGCGVKHPRRALSAEELSRLYAAAPAHRAIVYKIAAELGLRRNEIKHLKWEYFDWERGLLIIPAKITKNKKLQPLSIHPDFLHELKYLADESGKKVVKAVPDIKTLAKDLKTADIPYKDATGRFVDIHALRGTFITLMQANGAPQTMTQVSARHSDPRLTFGVYTDAPMLEKQAARYKPHIPLDSKKLEGIRYPKWTQKWTQNIVHFSPKKSQGDLTCRNTENSPTPVNIKERHRLSQEFFRIKNLRSRGVEPPRMLSTST